MPNDLRIERVLDTYFDIWINGGEKIRDERPTIRTRGDYVVILSKVGSNLFKEQKILYNEVTVIDTFGGTGTFASFGSIGALWLKLIEVKFIREDGSGSSGADLFTQLNDTFPFYGNDGKVGVVDEAQLKLIPTPFYNYNKITQHDDVEISALIHGKLLGIANVGGDPKVVQVNRPKDGTTYFSAVGGFDYNDLATQTTPLSYTSGDLQLTNDTLGDYTFLSQPPFGITSVWDESTNTFDFSQLSIGDEVFLRVHLNVTTTSSNQISGLKLLFGEGTPSEYAQPIDLQIAFKTAGAHNVLRELKFYIGNNDWKNTPAKILFNSDDDANVVVYGWHPYIIRKSINILDVNIQGGSDKPPYELATAGQIEIEIDSSSDNVDIWIGSVYQIENIHYHRELDKVVMNTPLDEGDVISKRYYTQDSVKEPFLIATDGQASITMTNNPRSVDVINGSVILTEGVHYNKSNNIINFVLPYTVDAGDYITVRKYR